MASTSTTASGSPTGAATPRGSSVYRVVEIVATHPESWEGAAAVGITELAKSIPDLRIARVLERDVALLDEGARRYRVKLAVSYRIDRSRVTDDGRVTMVRRYLVLANQTITGAALRQSVLDRIAAGPAEFHVVVPVRLQRIANTVLLGDPISGFTPVEAISQVERDAIGDAEAKLHEALAWIREAGATASGEVSTADPLAAVSTVLDRGSFDEIVVSTLPRAVSRWLGVDLPTRLARQTHLPIVHVEQRDDR